MLRLPILCSECRVCIVYFCHGLLLALVYRLEVLARDCILHERILCLVSLRLVRFMVDLLIDLVFIRLKILLSSVNHLITFRVKFTLWLLSSLCQIHLSKNLTIFPLILLLNLHF